MGLLRISPISAKRAGLVCRLKPSHSRFSQRRLPLLLSPGKIHKTWHYLEGRTTNYSSPSLRIALMPSLVSYLTQLASKRLLLAPFVWGQPLPFSVRESLLHCHLPGGIICVSVTHDYEMKGCSLSCHHIPIGSAAGKNMTSTP